MTAPVYTPVTHCIFDLDGLLLDTEPIYENGVHQICRSFGKEFTAEVKMKALGCGELQHASIIIDELALPISAEDFVNRLKDIVRENFSKRNLKLMKGAESLIHHLNRANIPMCVATSSGQEMAELKMSSHDELCKLFAHYVTGSDPEVAHAKPRPDIFLVAAKRFKVNPDPSECLVFEDSTNGVKAARAAGMQVVMVPDEIVPIEKRSEATVVLKSLDEFRPELFGLPTF